VRSEVGEFSTGQISTKDVVGSLHKQALTGEGGQHYPLQKIHQNFGDDLRAKKFLHGSAASARAKPTPKTFIHDFLTNLQSSSLQVSQQINSFVHVKR
jgi:hypothetical protein